MRQGIYRYVGGAAFTGEKTTGKSARKLISNFYEARTMFTSAFFNRRPLAPKAEESKQTGSKDTRKPQTVRRKAHDLLVATTEPFRAPFAKDARAIVTRTAAGLGVTVASSAALAYSVAPALLTLTAETASVADIYRSIPMVGGLLASIVGTGGVYGCVAASACMLSLTVALFSNQTGWQEKLKQGTAQVVQGLAMAPLWLLTPAAVTSALPCVGLAVACVAGMSMVVAFRGQGVDLSPVMAIAAIALGVSSAPMAARLALGVDARKVAGDALMLLGAAAVSCALIILSANWSAVKDDSTTFLWRSVVPSDPSKSLNYLGNRDPSVFLTDATLEAHLHSLDHKILEHEPIGLRPFLFSGPAGTGKTDAAQAIANQWKLKMFAPKAALLAESDHPAEQVTQYFEEARIQAAKDNRPVVLFFDEAEKLFTDRRTLNSNSDEAARAYRMTLAFNTEIEGTQGTAVPNIIVIAATNHFERLEPSIRSRFGATHITMAAPGPEQFLEILRVRWAQEQTYHPRLRRFRAFVPSPDHMNQLVGSIERIAGKSSFVGRDLIQCIRQAFVSVNYKVGPEDTDETFQAALVNAFAPAFEKQLVSVYGAGHQDGNAAASSSRA